MQLTPRYDGPPLIDIDGSPADQLVPLVRQRRRFLALLGGLTDEQWATPSRCEGWTVQDVAAHLVGVDRFWALSVSSGVGGSPTRFLAAFDPVATPSSMVAGMGPLAPAAVLEQLTAATDELLGTVEALDDGGWTALAESPPGHVPVRILAFHALWDCWIHERDVALPLGLAVDEEPDEVRSCLAYSAAIGPALALSAGIDLGGTYAVATDDPDLALRLTVGDQVRVEQAAPADGDPCLRGGAVDLVEELSIRAPLRADAPEPWRRLVQGLATAFDQPDA